MRDNPNRTQGGFAVSMPQGFYTAALALVRTAAPEPQHFRHALLLSEVMRRFAALRGHEGEADTWAAAGLLRYMAAPKSPLVSIAALKKAGADEPFLKAVTQAEPVTEEDSFATLLVTLDHLVALILAIAATRPRQSVKGLKVSAVQKKFLDTRFAPQSSRRQIQDGVRALRVEIGDFTSKTLKAILAAEEDVRNAAEKIA